MTIISIPLWIFITAVGLPSFCLIWLVASFLRRLKSGPAAPEANLEPMNAYTRQACFQQDLEALQIDAVFNGLVALIETERIKLKALIANNVSDVKNELNDAQSHENPTIEKFASPQKTHAESSEKEPDNMDEHLGLSLAEVELAMKVQASRMAHTGRKLEAVA